VRGGHYEWLQGSMAAQACPSRTGGFDGRAGAALADLCLRYSSPVAGHLRRSRLNRIWIVEGLGGRQFAVFPYLLAT
jgi:hypothetical protein